MLDCLGQIVDSYGSTIRSPLVAKPVVSVRDVVWRETRLCGIICWLLRCEALGADVTGGDTDAHYEHALVVWNHDRHVLRGQTSPHLSAVALLFDHDNDSDFASVYQAAHPCDVTLFHLAVQGRAERHPDRGAGLEPALRHDDRRLRVDAGAPATPKFNFMVEVLATNTPDRATFTEVIRFHVHGMGTRMCLTPSTLIIHPVEEALPRDPPYRFRVRAEFDDGRVGDLMRKQGVTLARPFNFAWTSEGLVTLMSADRIGAERGSRRSLAGRLHPVTIIQGPARPFRLSHLVQEIRAKA
jgi:hypothetical protein